jgi:hypothetical protein
MTLRLTPAQYKRLSAGKPVDSKPRRVKAVPVRFQRIPKKRSYAEVLWEKEGPAIMRQIVDAPIVRTTFEMLPLPLPGGRSYLADFWHLTPGGQILIVATKGTGSKKLKSYRDSRAALKECAELYRWARFFQADRVNGEWVVTEVEVGGESSI